MAEMVNIGKVKQFFFEASLRTYAGGMEKQTIAELPKSKVLIWEQGAFRYVDLYYVSVSAQQGFGQTTIWFNGVPVWGMQYGGFYNKSVIPFLKKALIRAYEDREFLGGRGPLIFQEGPFIYANNPNQNDFTNFNGQELIVKDVKGNPVMGRHRYSGLSLI